MFIDNPKKKKKKRKRQAPKTYVTVTTLGLAQSARENDELAAVFLQALGIGLERFRGSVAAAVIHGNANGLGNLAVDASSLRARPWSKSF